MSTEQPDKVRSSAFTRPPEGGTPNIPRAAIISSARSLIGTPFLHQGRDRTVGIDCRGLVLCICDDTGYQLIGDWPNNYRRKPDPQVLRTALETEFIELKPRDERQGMAVLDRAHPGDILLIRLPRQPEPTHLGICHEGPHGTLLTHALAYDGSGRVLEEPIKRWLPYVAAAFTWRPDRFQSAIGNPQSEMTHG